MCLKILIKQFFVQKITAVFYLYRVNFQNNNDNIIPIEIKCNISLEFIKEKEKVWGFAVNAEIK